MTSWVRFLCTAGVGRDNLRQDMLHRGIYQVLALGGGYLAPAAREDAAWPVACAACVGALSALIRDR